jgi:hypothetical protein
MKKLDSGVGNLACELSPHCTDASIYADEACFFSQVSTQKDEELRRSTSLSL